MTSASVGFQCPECVAAGAASVRQPRTRLGARMPAKAYVSMGIVGLCVVLYGWEMLQGIDAVAQNLAMFPAGIAVDNEYYRLFTSMFLHYSVLHIGFNMFVLWSLGPQLENIVGHVRFGVMYLLAGLGGSVASFWFSAPFVLSAGASGAIFGLMGAFVVVSRRLGADTRQVLGLIAVNVVIGFAVSNVDWRAHLGGLVTGAAVAAIIAYAPPRQRTLVQIAGLVAVFAVLVLLTVLRDQLLTAQLVTAGFGLTSA
ncbi:MAG: rhomboid family intramembrane serine protease [Actinomycetes bacterium]